MAKIKLAALDVDGTLVRSDLTLSPAVIRAVQSLEDAGVTAAIVTGRSMGELTHFRKALPWLRYFVVSNGATALDAEANNAFYQRHLPLAIARAVEREARKYSVMTEVYADGVSYVGRDCWEHSGRYTAEFLHHPSLAAGRVPVESVGDLLDARKSDVEKLYISFEDLADLPKLETFCRRYPVDLVLSIHNGLEVNQRGVEKGSGLLALCGYLGVSPEETAAVGDGDADVAMFRAAGLSIAMENANETVRGSASLVAPHNDSDGAIWAIEQILAAR
ncbi:MAG: Cof-type HAD-IIB family hydrolase [Clostridiales bacterium]|nr:Cof-type HAD-IIB family hydrolase [Clostridiales bacterium]